MVSNMATTNTRPRYRLVTDATSSHRGIPMLHAGQTFGSSRPYVAAVLWAKSYTDNDGTAATRWTISRTSFTRPAAETYCDELRGRGCLAVVVPMMPVK